MTRVFNRYKSKDRRKELRHNLTKGEVIVWQHLKGRRLGGFKFRRQESIFDFVVDFYCPELKLAVEVDGETHNHEEVFMRDQWRQKIIEKEGVTFKRYTSDDVFNHLDQTLEDLLHTCQHLERRRRRQTTPVASATTPPWRGGDDRRGLSNDGTSYSK